MNARHGYDARTQAAAAMLRCHIVLSANTLRLSRGGAWVFSTA